MTQSVQQPKADIIIPVHNQYSYTRTLLDSIYRCTDIPFHIYLIDNASTDETGDIGKIFTRNITILHNRVNLGWGGAINQGIASSHNPNLVFMSNTVEVSKGWLDNLLAFLHTHPRIGAVAPLDSNADNWQHVDRVRQKIVREIPVFLTEDLHERNRILQYHFHRAGILIGGMLNFFCTALSRRAVDEVGLFKESAAGNGGDRNYCHRLRKAGYVLGLALDTYVLHHSITSHPSPLRSTSRRADPTHRKAKQLA